VNRENLGIPNQNKKTGGEKKKGDRERKEGRTCIRSPSVLEATGLGGGVTSGGAKRRNRKPRSDDSQTRHISETRNERQMPTILVSKSKKVRANRKKKKQSLNWNSYRKPRAQRHRAAQSCKSDEEKYKNSGKIRGARITKRGLLP